MSWWRWWCAEIGSAWMAVLVLAIVVCAPCAVTAWALRADANTLTKLNRPGGGKLAEYNAAWHQTRDPAPEESQPAE